MKKAYQAEHGNTGDRMNANDMRYSEQAERLANETLAEVKAKAVTVKKGESFIDAVKKFARELGIYGTYETEAGQVIFDERGIQNSLSHTKYQNKADVIPAIPEVLTKGIYLGSFLDKDGKPIQNHYFCGSVKVGNDKKILFIRTRETEGEKNKFYVHEVY
ncbi:MAG: hypothetical protein MJZ22_05075, partial [Candidatus Saccharibacteria bacterium]|nr:hypothetical protein [Candidatus Saccharibacteria bacterium]